MKLGNVKTKPTLYSIGKNGEVTFTSERNTSKSLSPGVYTIVSDMLMGVYLSPKEMTYEKFIHLPDMQTNFILKDIDNFWKKETKERFDNMGLVYKRGILMHGKQGTGKTSTIFKVCEKFVEGGGVVIFNPNPQSLHQIVQNIQAIEPDKKILAIFEEFEYYLDDTNFLSLLDGELQLSNVVYVATTNFIEDVPARIKNRPSRFAQVLEIGAPSMEARLVYLQTKLGEVVPVQKIEQVASLTEGFVLDQVKDVLISHFVFDYPLEESIEKIKSFNYEEDALEEKEEEDEEDRAEGLSKLRY